MKRLARMVPYEVDTVRILNKVCKHFLILKLDYELTLQVTRLGRVNTTIIHHLFIFFAASTNCLVLNILCPSLSTFPLLQMSMVTCSLKGRL